jgi:methylthioribose-1-phosphate isomerase
MTKELRPLKWNNANSLAEVIDQRLLPHEFKWIEIKNTQEMAFAIKDMIIRGAPLIGIGAAYGMAMAARDELDLDETDTLLRSTRPTAVNLMWALDECKKVIHQWGLDRNSCGKPDFKVLHQKLLEKANWILEDDVERCKEMSRVGAEYIKKKFGNNKKFKILTHCNAGALATGGYGTALGVIRKLHEENLVEMVYSDETRPRQQGSKLTAWELAHDGIPVTMISDNMAAHCMKKDMIDFAVVGSDRITANGDAANKIGTYQVAIVCKHHNVPFYVAAPHSTIDLNLATGNLIPIEERDPSELHTINDKLVTASEGVKFFNPGFDVTPNELIEAIFTEKGLFKN